MALRSDTLQDARIVVIGAGVVGAAISYRLAQAGASVTTVERRYPGSGTSGNSFAWLNSFDKPPRSYHRLNIMSIRDHQELADELGGNWVHLDGGLHWEHATDEQATKTLRGQIRRLREWGVRVDTTTPEIAMRDLEPDLWIDPEKVSEVYVIPREGLLDPVPMAHGAIHAAVRQYGAKLVHGTVTGLQGVPGKEVNGVVLQDGRQLPADVVINATGPGGNQIAAMAGSRISMDTNYGFTMNISPGPICIKHVILTPEVNIRPEGAGRLILGRPEIDSTLLDDRPLPMDSPVVAEVMERARRIVPGLAEVPPDRVRTGVRALPSDGRSIVGFDPKVAGLYNVITHSGVTLSARLGILITEELAGGDTSELEPFRPTRFAA